MPEEIEQLNHLDSRGRAVMVDVSEKEHTRRFARAEGFIAAGGRVLAAIEQGSVAKGDVLAAARIAGIMAAKNCARIIPLCHSLALESVGVDIEADGGAGRIRVRCDAAATGPTGVEMEALTGVSAALLTIYDMCKALDRGMVIGGVRLLEKSGGQSGHFVTGKFEDDLAR